MFISNNYNKLSKSQTFFSNLNNFKQGLPELDLETIEEIYLNLYIKKQVFKVLEIL